MHTYNKGFLIVYGTRYVAFGARTMMNLALIYLFKEVYKIEPAYEEELDSIILLPESFKLFYGIFIDTFPIGGSRRKSYLIIFAFMQFIAFLCIALIPFQEAVEVAAVASFIHFCGAV